MTSERGAPRHCYWKADFVPPVRSRLFVANQRGGGRALYQLLFPTAMLNPCAHQEA